jgi:hypothetical protein
MRCTILYSSDCKDAQIKCILDFSFRYRLTKFESYLLITTESPISFVQKFHEPTLYFGVAQLKCSHISHKFSQHNYVMYYSSFNTSYRIYNIQGNEVERLECGHGGGKEQDSQIYDLRFYGDQMNLNMY